MAQECVVVPVSVKSLENLSNATPFDLQSGLEVPKGACEIDDSLLQVLQQEMADQGFRYLDL